MSVLKWLRRIMIAFIMLIAIILFFIMTNPGLKAIVYVSAKFMPGQLHYQKLDGALVGPITIDGLHYQNNGHNIAIQSFHFNWSPGKLFNKKLVINKLDVKGVSVIIPKDENESEVATKQPEKSTKQSIIDFLNNLKKIKLKPLTIPLSIQIHHARFSSIKIGHDKNNITTVIKSMTINGGISAYDMNMIITAKLMKPQALSITMNLKGSLEHYTADLTVRNKIYDFMLHVVGNQNAATFTILKGHAFGGFVQGRLAIAWYPNVNWTIHLNVKNINLQVFDQNIPQSISILLNTQGQIKDNDLLFDLASHIKADRATLQLTARHHKVWHAKWDLNIPEIETLYPKATGSFKATGVLHGQLTRPQTSGTLSGSDINVDTTHLESLKGNWQLYFDQSTPSIVNLTISQLEYNQNKLHMIHMNLSGDLLKHRLQARLSIAKPQLIFATQIHYDDSTWQGQITQLSWKIDDIMSGSLRQRAQFLYSPDKAYLKPLCIDVNAGGFVCMQATWQKNEPWHFYLQSKNFNFQAFEQKFIPSLDFNGKLSIHANVTGVGKKIKKASVKAILSPGILATYVDNDMINIAVRKSMFNLFITDKTGLKVNAALNFSQHDQLTVKAHIPNFTDYSTPFADKQLQTNIHVLVHNFRFLSILESTVWVPKGVLVGHFTLNGKIADPKLKGDAQLTFPKFIYTTVNLHAKNIKAHVHVDGNKLTYGLVGYAFNNAPLYFSGDTTLLEPYAITHFEVHAHNAEAIKTKQLDVFANTRLKFLLTHDQLDIMGYLTVPKAMISAIDFGGISLMPVNQVTYSNLPKTIKPETSRKKTLDLKLGLGKDVYFKGYGADANLRGHLALSVEPEKGAVANGQFRIAQGAFKAYGQDLKIADGSSVNFHNSQITDPYINARAYKYVTTTMDSAGMQLANNMLAVGLQIHGTLNDLKFNLYSHPPGVPQADILSYLVLGVPADNANAAALSVFFNTGVGVLRANVGPEKPETLSGIKKFLNNTTVRMRNETVLDVMGFPVQDQASLLVGHQLTNNFYVQYSQGLIIPESIFSLKYRLSKHWAIQSQAGSGYNVGVGADVLYSIEK